MTMVEINFDGIIGPSHNYAGLSLGNLASASHAGDLAYPRAAALQGLAKMRHNMALGLVQGFLLPLPRPNTAFLAAIGADGTEDRRLNAAAWSASSMWTANAATVSPAADTADGRCHLTAANLVTMPHRSQEWPDTVKQLRIAFADGAHFAVHDAVPPCFGDEGAANHMRMAASHDAPGLEIFVYGTSGGAFPARQHLEASRAVARLHRLNPARTLFVEQNPEAIAAGAFHNDVVAVANERVLFTHEQAFADPAGTYGAIRERLPEAELVVVPAAEVSLADAIESYLFNAQLLTLPSGEMALVVPSEAIEHPRVRRTWTGCWQETARSGPFCRSTCASPWPMAAVPRACACAWSPTRQPSMRASCWTRREQAGSRRSSSGNGPNPSHPTKSARPCLQSGSLRRDCSCWMRWTCPNWHNPRACLVLGQFQ